MSEERSSLSEETQRRIWSFQKRLKKRNEKWSDPLSWFRAKAFESEDSSGGFPFVLYQTAVFLELVEERLEDLGLASCRLLLQDRVVPAAILARAFGETGALIFTVIQELNEAEDQQAAEKTIRSALLGSSLRYPAEGPYNVGALIRSASDEPEFLARYQHLCELAHPNFLGLTLPYGGKQEFRNQGTTEMHRDQIAGLSLGFMEGTMDLLVKPYGVLWGEVVPKLLAFLDESSG